MTTDDFLLVARSLRVPGLGLLVLPAAPAPAWLLAPPLHTALAVRLHRPAQPPLSLLASLEEVAPAGEPAARALLLTTDPDGPVSPGDWLALLTTDPADLLLLL